MSRPAIADEVAGFRDWLVTNEGKSGTTANGYASAVRYVIRNAKLSNLSEERYIYAMYAHQKVDHQQKRTAWLWFCKFKGITPTHPHLVGSGIAHANPLREPDPLPVALKQALVRYMDATGHSLTAIQAQNWKNIRQSGAFYLLKFPDGNYQMTHAEMTPFMAYANFAPGMEAPFIPAVSGGGEAYPLHLLKTEVRHTREAMLHEKVVAAEPAPPRVPQPPAITPVKTYDRHNPPKDKPVDASKWEYNKIKIMAMMSETEDPWEYMLNVPEDVRCRVDAELADMEKK